MCVKSAIEKDFVPVQTKASDTIYNDPDKLKRGFH